MIEIGCFTYLGQTIRLSKSNIGFVIEGYYEAPTKISDLAKAIDLFRCGCRELLKEPKPENVEHYLTQKEVIET